VISPILGGDSPWLALSTGATKLKTLRFGPGPCDLYWEDHDMRNSVMTTDMNDDDALGLAAALSLWPVGEKQLKVSFACPELTVEGWLALEGAPIEEIEILAPFHHVFDNDEGIMLATAIGEACKHARIIRVSSSVNDGKLFLRSEITVFILAMQCDASALAKLN
jgi:hypothetical protein